MYLQLLGVELEWNTLYPTSVDHTFIENVKNSNNLCQECENFQVYKGTHMEIRLDLNSMTLTLNLPLLLRLHDL